MIFQISIQHDQAIQMLLSLGFEVKLVEKPMKFPTYHGQYLTETISVWVIKNPKTGVDELLTNFLDNYVRMKSEKLFLSTSEDEIMSLIKSGS